MKILFAIPFAFLMLLQSLHISIEDLVKIPEFVEHFQEHQEKYGDDFFSFMHKHYGAEKENHKSEDSEHEDLPFHQHHHFCVDLKVDIPLLFQLNTLEAIESKHFFVYTDPITTNVSHSIHQPPKHNC
ncbi:MAG: hypothetical protein WED10_04955 [Brumimicrobium sp.]